MKYFLTESELRVRDWLRRSGFRVLRNGWPDFLAIKANSIMTVEVKSGIDRISAEQFQMQSALRLGGVPTVIPNC
jgi:hypothetical protein